MNLIEKFTRDSLVPVDKVGMAIQRRLWQPYLQPLGCESGQQFVHWCVYIKFAIPVNHKLLHLYFSECCNDTHLLISSWHYLPYVNCLSEMDRTGVNAYPAAGSTPSCCTRRRASTQNQRSTSLPSMMRARSIPLQSSCLPVGAIPNKLLPVWVPV